MAKTIRKKNKSRAGLGKRWLRLEMDGAVLDGLESMGNQCELTLSAYVRLVLAQHARCPMKIELRKSS